MCVCVCVVFTLVLIKTDCISLLLYIIFAHNVNLFVAISLDHCQVQCGIAGQTKVCVFLFCFCFFNGQSAPKGVQLWSDGVKMFCMHVSIPFMSLMERYEDNTALYMKLLPIRPEYGILSSSQTEYNYTAILHFANEIFFTKHTHIYTHSYIYT